jgi:hypothetical protein
MFIVYMFFYVLKNLRHLINDIKLDTMLKAYRLSELIFFVDIKSCQYSMFYTNKMSEQEARFKKYVIMS